MKRLIELRKQADMTQTELAGVSGVSIHTISNLEGGRYRPPKIETLAGLARALALVLGEEVETVLCDLARDAYRTYLAEAKSEEAAEAAS